MQFILKTVTVKLICNTRGYAGHFLPDMCSIMQKKNLVMISIHSLSSRAAFTAVFAILSLSAAYGAEYMSQHHYVPLCSLIL